MSVTFDDVAERHERLVDVLGLLEAVACGLCLLGALAARQVDQRH